jgi:hypothetical protein
MLRAHTENENGSVRRLHTTGSPEEAALHSISRVREPQRPSASDTDQAAWR